MQREVVGPREADQDPRQRRAVDRGAVRVAEQVGLVDRDATFGHADEVEVRCVRRRELARPVRRECAA